MPVSAIVTAILRAVEADDHVHIPQPASPRRPRRRLIAVAVAVWALLVILGLGLLIDYKSAPSARASAQAQWPDGGALTLDPGLPTVVMFAHPHCPCTRASVSELAEIVRTHAGRAAVTVVFMHPPGTAEGFEQTSLWDTVGAIPGAVRLVDDGSETRRFGARTSGQVFVYAPSGALLYDGGITGSRGHVGENAGRQAVVAILEGARLQSTLSVFGCGLFASLGGSL